MTREVETRADHSLSSRVGHANKKSRGHSDHGFSRDFEGLAERGEKFADPRAVPSCGTVDADAGFDTVSLDRIELPARKPAMHDPKSTLDQTRIGETASELAVNIAERFESVVIADIGDEITEPGAVSAMKVDRGQRRNKGLLGRVGGSNVEL